MRRRDLADAIEETISEAVSRALDEAGTDRMVKDNDFGDLFNDHALGLAHRAADGDLCPEGKRVFEKLVKQVVDEARTGVTPEDISTLVAAELVSWKVDLLREVEGRLTERIEQQQKWLQKDIDLVDGANKDRVIKLRHEMREEFEGRRFTNRIVAAWRRFVTWAES